MFTNQQVYMKIGQRPRTANTMARISQELSLKITQRQSLSDRVRELQRRAKQCHRKFADSFWAEPFTLPDVTATAKPCSTGSLKSCVTAGLIVTTTPDSCVTAAADAR